MDYKHAYLNTLLLLHSAFMLNVEKMLLKGEISGHALNSHGNCIVYRGKSWKNHGIVLLNFCGNPAVLDNSIYYIGSKPFFISLTAEVLKQNVPVDYLN